jgi:hypothetical protein
LTAVAFAEVISRTRKASAHEGHEEIDVPERGFFVPFAFLPFVFR